MIKEKFILPVRDIISRLYLSAYYPVLVGALVFFGHAFGIELYLGGINIVFTSLGLLLTGRARPLIFFTVSFAYQISRTNSPGIPNPSDYYFSSWRLPVFITLVALFLISVLVYSVRSRLFDSVRLLKAPLLLPLSLLSSAFILNGAFSDRWSAESLVFGILEVLCFSVIFIFFYLALLREKEGLLDYLVYCLAAVAVVICLEVLWCYIVTDNPAKENIVFGWGIWNTAGASLVILLPVMLYGFAVRDRRYLSVFTLTFLCAMLTQSRNAQLFGILITVLSLFAFVLYGKKRAFAVSSLVFAAFAAVIIFLALGDFATEFLTRFFDDNGRIKLWRMGIENFLSAPIFGVGFFGADFGTFFTADFLPTMAHNTFIQLLSSMGLYGLFAYLFYRVATLVPFIKKHSFSKTVLGLCCLVFLLESLLDNFVFLFLPTLQYTVILASVFVTDGAGRKNYL